MKVLSTSEKATITYHDARQTHLCQGNWDAVKPGRWALFLSSAAHPWISVDCSFITSATFCKFGGGRIAAQRCNDDKNLKTKQHPLKPQLLTHTHTLR